MNVGIVRVQLCLMKLNAAFANLKIPTLMRN